MPAPTSTDRTNISGEWQGQYNYPHAKEPVPFAASLMDLDGTLAGVITEKSTLPPNVGEKLYATIRGVRDGNSVVFRKTYKTEDVRYQFVDYEGMLNDESTEIEGVWSTGGWSGRFLMVRSLGDYVVGTQFNVVETVK
jgi:hypothetical protein